MCVCHQAFVDLSASSLHCVIEAIAHYLSLQRSFETQISCHAKRLLVLHTVKNIYDFL